MRRSSENRPLGVLRNLLGLTQIEIAGRLCLDRDTYQSLERGRDPVTWPMAEQISYLTGLSAAWLVAGDPKAPMVDRDGKPYTLQTFHTAQRQSRPGKLGQLEATVIAEKLGEMVSNIFSITLRAYTQDKFPRSAVAILKSLRWISEEFGRDQKFDNSTSGLAGTLEMQMRIISCAFGLVFSERQIRKLRKREEAVKLRASGSVSG